MSTDTVRREEFHLLRRQFPGSGRYVDRRASPGRRLGCQGASLDLESAFPNGERAASRRTRKMSLSCLANSILSLEKGRRKPMADNSQSKVHDQELLQAAETGDVASLRRLLLLQDQDTHQLTCTDMLGRTPLNLAVANEHQEVVQLLLDYVDAKSAYEALLLAIKVGHDEIAEMILEHPKYDEINAELRKDSSSPFFSDRLNDHSQFTEETNPMILAAQNNRYEVVMALLMKGQLIEKPHKYNCICLECSEKQKTDELKFAKGRLNAYKGLASEAYISLSSEDPILTSFELRNELNDVAAAEKYYTADYNELATNLSNYVVKLLDKVQGNEELNVILHNPDGLDMGSPNKTLARLQLAIQYKEKKFVAHPSCQKKLTTLWYSNCEWLKNQPWGIRMVIIILIAILYPFMALLYTIAPRSKVATFVRSPCIKFVAETASFFIFMGMIVGNSFAERRRLCDTTLKDDPVISQYWKSFGSNITGHYASVGIGTNCIRTYKPAPLQICIGIWISALLWQEIKQLYQDGAVGHFSSIYNHMDFVMLKCYIASFTLRFVTYLKTYKAMVYFKRKESWLALLNENPESQYLVYWLVPDRYYWDTLDPTNMCEALYSVANVLTFARLFYLLAINEHLGPMLITLERMTKDVMKFMVTFWLMLLAFMVGLHNLYWYYKPSIRKVVELRDHSIHTRAEASFGTLEFTFRTVFWALFGLSESRVVEIGQGFQSRFTESVGYIIFGVYNFVAVIVLLNMLIAMMTRSFEKITRDQDAEWKFARSQLYMEYIKQGSTLPVPFNIIPTPKSIVKVLNECYRTLRYFLCHKRYCRGSSEDIREMNGILGRELAKHYSGEGDAPNTYSSEDDAVFVPLREINAVDRDPPSNSDQENGLGYKTVVKKVVRRYIFERLQAVVVSNEGDIDVIRQTIGNIQEDGRQKQRDIDVILMQQNQVLETVNTIRDDLVCVQRSTLRLSDQLQMENGGQSPSSKGSDAMTRPSSSDSYMFGPSSSPGLGGRGSDPSLISQSLDSASIRKRSSTLASSSFLVPVTESIQEES